MVDKPPAGSGGPPAAKVAKSASSGDFAAAKKNAAAGGSAAVVAAAAGAAAGSSVTKMPTPSSAAGGSKKAAATTSPSPSASAKVATTKGASKGSASKAASISGVSASSASKKTTMPSTPSSTKIKAKKSTTTTPSSFKSPSSTTTSSPLSTTLKSGPAHWDSIKSRLLAACSSSPSGRPEALKVLAELRDRNLAALPAGEHSLLLSALLPALTKILVSPNGKACVLINAIGVKEKGAKGGGSKKRKKDKADATTAANVAEGGKSGGGNTTTTTLHPTKQSKKQSSSTTNTPACHVPPSSNIHSTNHKIRSSALHLLEQISQLIIHNNPSHNNELFRPHAPTMLSLAIHVMIDDYEDNAVMANGLVVRMLRGYKMLMGKQLRARSGSVDSADGGNKGIMGTLATSSKEGTKMLRECQALLEFSIDCYKYLGVRGNMIEIFEAAAAQVVGGGEMKMSVADTEISGGSSRSKDVVISAKPALAGADASTATTKPLKASSSYRLLCEAPMTIMLLFQLYPKFPKANIGALMPAVMDLLKIMPPSPPGPGKVGSTPSSKGSSTPGSTTPGAAGLRTPALGATPSMKMTGKAPKASTPSLSTPRQPVAKPGVGTSTPASSVAYAKVLKTPGGASVSSKMSTPLSSLPPATPATARSALTASEASTPRTPASALAASDQASYELRKRHYQSTLSALLASQIKALSFVTQLIRNNMAGDALKPYEESLASCVLQLLRSTSSSSSMSGSLAASMMGSGSSTAATGGSGAVTNVHQITPIQMRKELLMNTRYLLSTDFRRGFYRHVDTMLDERLLIGSTRLSSRSAIGDGLGIGIGGAGVSSWASIGAEGFDSTGSASSLLQPLGYSILAEFISQVRLKLTPAQVSRTIRIFSRVLHCDLSPYNLSAASSSKTSSVPSSMQHHVPNFSAPYSTMQITAGKLLTHLVDVSYHNRDPNPQAGRDLLFRILRTCVHKLEVVAGCVPGLVEAMENLLEVETTKCERRPKTSCCEDGATQDVGEDPFQEDEAKQRVASLLTTVRDFQHLLRPIIHGMKALFWCINSYSLQREKERQRSSLAGEEQYPLPAYAMPSAHHPTDYLEEVHSATLKMSEGEREMVHAFVRHGLPCLRIFKWNVSELERMLFDTGNSPPLSTSRPLSGGGRSKSNKRRIPPKHREILELFAMSFTSLESYNFRKIMVANLHFIIEQMDNEEDNVAMFSHLLLGSGKAVSYQFCDILLGYLVENVGELGKYESEESSQSSQPSDPAAKQAGAEQQGHAQSGPSGRDLASQSSPLPSTTVPQLSSPPAVLSKRAQNLSKVFSLAFSSLLKYPRNESSFLPHLQKLVKECIQRSMEEGPPGGVGELVWPGPYLNTLRALFRMLSGGKFDNSYKELLPLIPTILNNFYRIYTCTYSKPLRLVLLELCLTVPSRLSVLLPHLPLLIKIIIPALQSNVGDLINLGLRTLEFWVDNLHPDFLYPIFAQDSDTLCELMLALSMHLQPAPYPYGLLCMRLLGKMGGTNRLFLRELVGFNDGKSGGKVVVNTRDNLSMYCEWQSSDKEGGSDGEDSFLLPFPLRRAVDVLRYVAAAPHIIIEGRDNNRTNQSFQGKHFSKLLSMDPGIFDSGTYSVELMDETKKSQSRSAFGVLRAALASIISVEEGNGLVLSICTKNGSTQTRNETIAVPLDDKEGQSIKPQQGQHYNEDFKLICDGLFAAAVHKDLQNEAMLLLKGLGSHIFYLLANNREHITRIDRDGCPIDSFHGSGLDNEKYDSQNHISEHGKLQPLKPFGSFQFSGPLDGIEIDPFVFNESLADAFTDADVKDSHVAAMEVMEHVIELYQKVEDRVMLKKEGGNNEPMDVDTPPSKDTIPSSDTACNSTTWGDIFLENLLSKLCQCCFSKPWNHRSCVMTGVFELINKMGQTWSKQFEVEILHTTMFLVKNTPDGIAHASKDSIRFFLQVTWFFFGGPPAWKDSSAIVNDILCPLSKKPVPLGEDNERPISVKKASLTLILSEIASTKPLVRFVVRHVLRLITRDSASITSLLSNHVLSLKRLLFPKLLRTLPLPNQCAAVEACAFILDRAPKLIPIADQNLLAFLSELLKMISIADGEFSDTSFGSVVLIDKHGYVNNGGEATGQTRSTIQASSVFLRKSFVLEDDSFGGRVQVPAELPLGVQLRVSTLLLFRGLIRGFSDEFYDADSQSKIGNIRPHVVALLFRSLISEPPEAVASSASALHDALILCVSSKDKEEGSMMKGNRLPKELIQSCIRPILLNLREHTKLSIPLLRGLSRLLGLLSSWFNKTLGEKLLDHLHKFEEPEKIMQLQVFKPGEEPLVAAAVMDLFALLPQASHFVESLVKVTLRLEAVLPRYKSCLTTSPFRAPLAKYLNRHCASAVGYFLEVHRLCNPEISSLFHDMLGRGDDTAMLRKYLSANSVMLLNVCFERPLAIIRAEKTSAPEGKPMSSSLAVYGINEWSSPSAQRKLEIARQDIEMRKKFLASKTTELSRAQKSVQSKEKDDPNLSEYQATAQAAREAVEHAKRELEEARRAYTRDASQAITRCNPTDKPPMTISGLELQYQGFRIVELLTKYDPRYLVGQNDVVRALRWLWRSRGRHYRLLHEEEIPPRYHCESLSLGKFLVSYSQANPSDTDVLFDLIRIFLQPLSSVDFSFVKDFLLRRVSRIFSAEQKSLIIQRFSTLLSSEGSEETKIISASMLAIPLLKQSSSDAIFNDPSMKMLTESLLKDSSHGPKLLCELLQIVDVLLERMQSKDLTQYRKDLLKFIWAVLKCNDATTKYYAYLAVSRFISIYDTPSKVVLQVYRSLLCDTSERNTVRMAMDVLLPSLRKRLDNDELDSAMQFTSKLLQEEENSISQIAHIWETITRHPLVYISHKLELIPHMLDSLSLLALQPNASSELAQLSVALAKLIFDWSIVGQTQQSSQGQGTHQSLVTSVLNILMRLAFVTATDKPDRLHQQIRAQILSLLKDIVSFQRNCEIESSHFQNALLHGTDTQCTEGTESTGKESSDSKSDDNGGAKAALLLCADIVLIFLRHDPTNDFIEENICALIRQCIAFTAAEKTKFTETLEDVIIHILVDGYSSTETVAYIVAMLENSLRESNHEQKHCKAYFAVSVIKKVCEKNKGFIEPFLGSLANLAEGIANDQSTSMRQLAESGRQHQLSATPTIGVFEVSCGLGFKPPSIGKDVQSSNGGFKNQITISSETLDKSTETLISLMGLLASSDSLATFSRTRSTVIKVLDSILNMSRSLPVLMAAVSMVGKWVIFNDQGMLLTKSEREGFLCQLAFFDFRRLPDLSSQALGDMICSIILSACGYDSTIIQEYPFGFDRSSVPNCKVKSQEFFQQVLSLCCLSANPYIRSLSMGIFPMQFDDKCLVLVHEKLSKIAIGAGCRNGDFMDVAGIPSQCPSKILNQVLRADFEALGMRLWTILIADVLLASSKHNAGVISGRQGLNHQLFITASEGEGNKLLQGLRLCNEKPGLLEHTVNLTIGESSDDVYSSFKKLIMPERSKELCGRGRCIAAIRSLIHGDAETCQSMLEVCVQEAWQRLPSNKARSSLIEPLGKLLARPFHTQFIKSHQCSPMNAVQSMMKVLVNLRPMPAIDPFLLASLSINYNAHNEAISLLESQYVALKTNGYDVDSSYDLMKATQLCFESIGDRDVTIAISSATSRFSGTKFALSLDMYDFVNESSDAYLSLMDRAEGNPADFLPTENEMRLWESRWVDSYKEMSQWPVIDEYATSTGNSNLMLECAWKTNNWEKVKSVFSLPSVVALLEEGDPLTKMTEIYLAINDGALEDVENLHFQTAQLFLHRWKLLPSVGAGRSTHTSLFQQFQRLVELRETSQILVEVSSHSARRAIPDLKLVLGSWRHRLPNSFEPVSVWNDIYQWRFQTFSKIASSFAWSDPNTIATLHDRPFACISLGRAARKQGLAEVATFCLNSLCDGAMDVEYAFLKLREQIINYQCSSEESLKGGLSLVNSTNLSFFDSRQKAEMFRLKAHFLNALNEKPKSNQSYCHAVQICPNYARCWIDWGLLCSSLSDDTRHKASGDENVDSKELAKKTGLYLVQAMGCFLEAVRCDPNEQSRDHIPYCLSMLANDGSTYGNLCRTFETRSAVLPSWVWLPWLPQLLSSLCRVEARAMKGILAGILKDHPQALYYSLRSFYLERRDIERSKGQKTDDDTLSSSRLAEEFMSNLRKAHPVLWSKLESILEDLIVRFRPSYEAELLHSVVALLQKVSKPEYKTAKDGGTDAMAQLHACTKMLGTKFFNFNKERPESSISRKAAQFHARYASLFKRDFLGETENGGANGADLVVKLQKWKKLLELGLARVPKTSSLQEVSPSLSWFSSQAPDLWAGACESKSLTLSNSQHDSHVSLDNALYRAKRSSALAAAKASSQAVLVAANSEGLGGHTGGGTAVVEIPGQYAPTSSSVLDARPFPELHAKLVRFHQTLELTSNDTKQHVHRITMIGSDGKTYSFLLSLAMPYWIRTDERSAQVNYVIGKLLRRDNRACRRSLITRPSVVVPVAQRMRMSAINSTHTSLDSVFCHVQGPNSNGLISHFNEKVASSLRDFGELKEEQKSEKVKEFKLKIYQDFCQKLVLPNLLSKYMRGVIAENLFQYRQVFASQLAANSLLQYAFAIVERTPNRFAFCNATGKMFCQDFRSQYNHGLLENHDVPFRMTRNITEFIGPFLLEGVFVPSFASISTALHSKQNILEPILHLLLRDDVMSWYISKSSPKNDHKMQEVERQLTDRIWKNVRFVQNRFDECSLRKVGDAASEAVETSPDPIDIKVRSLVDAATSEENLIMMPATYQAWL